MSNTDANSLVYIVHLPLTLLYIDKHAYRKY